MRTVALPRDDGARLRRGVDEAVNGRLQIVAKGSYESGSIDRRLDGAASTGIRDPRHNHDTWDVALGIALVAALEEAHLDREQTQPLGVQILEDPRYGIRDRRCRNDERELAGGKVLLEPLHALSRSDVGILLIRLVELTREKVAQARRINACQMRVQDVTLEVVNRPSPEGARVIEQLCNDTSRVGVALLLELHEAHVAVLVDAHEIRIAGRESGFPSHDDKAS